MPFNNQSDEIAGQRNGQWIEFAKGSVTSEGVGTYQSLWKAAGMPAAAATPPAFNAGSGYVPDKSTLGALPYVNPASGAVGILSVINIDRFVTAGCLVICDRLWACSGFGTVVTTAQNVTTPGTLPTGRDPNNGADVIPFLEVYTAPGATGATWTVTGTDALGNTNRTWVYTHQANAETVGQLLPLLPGGASPAATLGMRQANSFQASVSSGTAGDVGITLLRWIGDVASPANDQRAFKGPDDCGRRQIFDDSCLMLRVLCSTTSTGLIQGRLLVAKN